MKSLHLALTIVVLPVLLVACDSHLTNMEAPSDDAKAVSQGQESHVGITPGQANIVEVTPTHHHHDGEDEHHFELSTDDIPSGWTTFRFDNSDAHATHFAYLAKMPNSMLQKVPEHSTASEYYHEKVTKPFQPFLDNFEDGLQLPDDLAPLARLPDWFYDVSFWGGVGLTAAGQTSQSTVHLEPGTYIMECYVKTEDNRFHSFHGMLEDVEVTSESSGASEPRSSLEVTLSRENGLEFQGEVRSGKHTFKVFIKNQASYGGFGHDVHLIRLDDADIEEVKEWMDWTAPTGLVSSHDSPGPQTFLGGVHDIFTPWALDQSATAYFTVNLEPGEYALLSEVPYENPSPLLYPDYPEGLDDLVETFTVPTRTARGR